MSGASALAAAKRRRSKVDSNKSTSSNRSGSNISTSNNDDNSSMPQRMNVQQSFQYIWQKILQLEQMIQNNSVKVNKNSNSNVPSNEINELKQKVNSVERSIQLLSNTSKNEKTVEVNGEKFVSIDQFNDVMTKVGSDMQGVSEKMTELSNFVLNVQNNNIMLRNMLDSLQNDTTFGFDDGSVSSSGLDSKQYDQNVDNQSVDNQSVDNQSVDNQSVDNQSVDNQSLDNQSLDNQSLDNQSLDNQSLDDISVEVTNQGSINTSTDINSVLDKLKTLNSDEIKDEVAAELNNNITLVVEDVINTTTDNLTN